MFRGLTWICQVLLRGSKVFFLAFPRLSWGLLSGFLVRFLRLLLAVSTALIL